MCACVCEWYQRQCDAAWLYKLKSINVGETKTFIEGKAKCVWDNGATLLTSRQEVNCDWWIGGSKQEAFPCELPAPVFPCQHANTHTHMHTGYYSVPMSPCVVHTHSYIMTHFIYTQPWKCKIFLFSPFSQILVTMFSHVNSAGKVLSHTHIHMLPGVLWRP